MAIGETNGVQATVEDLPARGGAQKRVVVVGAGASGLAAAYQLRRAGHEVVVLEARTRPGGRVHSVRRDFADGLHAEAGALFIPTEHEYLMKYLTLTGITAELQPIRPEQLGGFYHLQGQRYLDDGSGPRLWRHDDTRPPTVWPGDLADEEQRLGLDELFERYMERIEGDTGDPHAADWPPAHLCDDFDEQAMPDLLRSLGATDGAVELIRATHLAALGDTSGNVSPLFVLQGWADTRRISNAATWNTIPGGNDRWLTCLAAMLKEQIHYGSEVIAIEDAGDGVTVTSRRNGIQSTAEGDYVICALPFSVLRHIAITPEMSVDKRRVISELQSTPLSHLFIQCERRVWRHPNGQGLVAFSSTDTDLAVMFRDATFNQSGPRAILDLYMVGPQSERMDALEEEERLRVALVELERIFPGITAVAEGSVYHSWNQDPFSRGDYVSYSAGQFKELWPYVTTPEGRIYFAGDQTSVKSAWQDGAIASGHRAALEVSGAGDRATASRDRRLAGALTVTSD